MPHNSSSLYLADKDFCFYVILNGTKWSEESHDAQQRFFAGAQNDRISEFI